MDIKYVCFNITEQCNMLCPYCYRVGNGKETADYTDAKRYIDHLIDLGCETISITGGEPLLNHEWRRIVDYCKEKKLYVILSTNGLILDLDDLALKHIDVLSVPLDGAAEEINRNTRAPGHFDTVKILINKYIAGNYPFQLKINTVITKYNINDLFGIENLLNNSRIIWKLFEYREKGLFNRFPSSEIPSTNEVTHAIMELKSSDHKCKIIYMGKHDKDMDNCSVKPNYIVLNCNGDLYYSTEDKDMKIYNINDEKASAKINFSQLHDLNNQYMRGIIKYDKNQN